MANSNFLSVLVKNKSLKTSDLSRTLVKSSGPDQKNTPSINLTHDTEETFSIGEIFKFSPNIKYLKVNNFGKLSLPSIKFPALEFLVLNSLEGIEPTELEHFLHSNSKIKRFACGVNYHKIESVKKLLKTIIKTKTIEELFLKIEGVLIDFEEINDELLVLDTRDNFKRLEIEVTSICDCTLKNTLVLTNFTSLTGFHMSTTWFDFSRHASIFSMYENLQYLQLHMHSINHESAMALAKNLKNLRRLLISCDNDAVFRVDVIAPFIRYGRKLNAIVVSHLTIVDQSYGRISELNAERAKLQNAFKLTVYIDDCMKPPIFIPRSTSCDLFEVKRMKIQLIAWQAHPFVPFFMLFKE